jgi:iron complex transport system ATP-binding protein
MLELRNIGYEIGGAVILDDVSASFATGRLSMIIGPNGSGKSTLLRIAAGELRPRNGDVLYDGAPIPGRRELAAVRAVLSQRVTVPFPLAVEDVVMMGRYPHFGAVPSARDVEIRDLAMKKADVDTFRGRNYLTLSGGEQQMVQLARALAQIWEGPAPRTLLLDEPTTYLDINHQHHLLATLRSILDEGMTVVAVMHDVNLASQYADAIIALRRGVKVADGTPEEVITAELFASLYDMRGTIIRSSDLDFPLIVF